MVRVVAIHQIKKKTVLISVGGMMDGSPSVGSRVSGGNSEEIVRFEAYINWLKPLEADFYISSQHCSVFKGNCS